MAKNALISWSNLTDSAGRKINEYTLAMNKGGIIDWMPKIYMVGVDFLWNAFMFISALAATALSWIGNPSWLNGLDNAYKKLTESMFSIVNPMVLATLGFVLLMFFIFIDSVKSNSTSFDKNDYNRVAAGFFMMVCIGALAANPFMLLKFALSIVQTGVAAIAGKDAASLDVFSVDAMIRQPTLIITYNGAVNEKCANLWSKTGGLEDNGACFDVGQNQPSAVTLVLAFLAFLMSVAAFAFAAWAAWKYIKHLTIAVLGFVSLPWVAAMSMFRRRQFDQLGTVAAVAAGNMMMVFIVQVISLGGPTLVSQIMSDWGQTGSAVLQMIVLMLTYVILLGALVTATNKSGPLVRALKADTSTALRTYMGSPGSGWNLDAPTFTQMITGRARNTNIYRRLQGKVADIMGTRTRRGQNEVLEDVQRTVNLPSTEDGPFSGEVIETSAYANSYALIKGTPLNGSDIRLSLSPGPNKAGVKLVSSTIPGGPGASTSNFAKVAAASVRAAADANSPVKVTTAGANLPAVREPGFVEGLSGDLQSVVEESLRVFGGADVVGGEGVGALLKEAGGNLLSSITPESASELASALVAYNMHSDNPMFGGRTPEDVIKNIIRAAASDMVQGATSIVANNTITYNSTTTAGDNTGVSTSVGVSAASRMAEYQKAREVLEAGSVAALTSGDSVGAGAVQHTVQQSSREVRQSQQSVTPTKVITRYVGPTAGDRAPNTYLGSPATRGDVVATRISLPVVCDRAEDEVVVETAVMKNRASGKGGFASFSLDDKSHDVRFSPDRPGQIVSAAVGVGFGDNIY